jgi:phage terminase large subunit GpA-like protein
MDAMGPHSPIIGLAVMKGAQLGLTMTAENIIGYWMDASPAPIMILSATDALLTEWADKRLEPLIDSLGIRSKIVAQQENNKKSRKSGDKALSKSFSGGFLLMVSAQSPGKMRSMSIRVLIRDEIDGAPRELRTGEGNWLQVSEARTNAWGAKKKIFDLSTPTTVEESAILVQYNKGDKRKFQVPCPHCGEFQHLEFGGEKQMYGLKPVFSEDGFLLNVFYMCKHCNGEIYNHHKTEIFKRGKWVAASQSYDPLYRSYHLSSLYSPVGMLSWKELYQKYLLAKDEPDGMRSFTNLYLGLPFRERGSRPKVENVVMLRGDYERGDIPEGVVFLTAAIDVQQGSQKKDTKYPARLEMEIRGHGRLWRSWSIGYHVFEGEIDNPTSGAWRKLQEFVNDGGFRYRDKRGREFPVRMVFIDSGDGKVTDTVYNFCMTWPVATYPIKGENAIKKNKAKDGDTIGTGNFTPWRASKINENTTLIRISTNYYKRSIYSNLHSSYLHRVSNQDESSEEIIQREAPAGFANFPKDYSEEYFNMLTAEEQRSDGSFHSSGRRNEALDLAVYNSAASDFFLNQLVMNLRLAHKNSGGNESDLVKIDTAFAFDFLEKQIGG